MTTQTRISRALKPVSELVVLNAETTGNILLRQNALVNDVISASVNQVKALTEAGSLREAVDFQRTYLRELGSRVRTTARDNVETLRDAGREATGVVRGALQDVRGATAEAANDAAESLSSVADAVDSQADSQAAPAPSPAPANEPASIPVNEAGPAY